EASELAYFGAKILHPSTIVPAQKHSVPVRLKNTMDEKAPGTLISNKETESIFKAVAAKDGITAIKIKSSRMLMAYGFLRRVFEMVAQYNTPVDMTSTAEVAVSVTIEQATHLENILAALSTFGSVEIDREQSLVGIVGHRIGNQKGVLDKIFHAL